MRWKPNNAHLCTVCHTCCSSLPPPGEKPFETIEDLVQDGLITLYMEANHVEDYLKSARDSRSLRRVVGVGQDTSASNGAVFSEESIGGDVPPPVPSRGVSQRKLPYQPCTFPHRKDTINVPAAPSHAHELHRIYEEVRDDDLPPPVPNGLERPLMPNILKPPMNPVCLFIYLSSHTRQTITKVLS